MTAPDAFPAGGIDFARSHAILLGVSEYEDRNLRNLPAAEHSLRRMAQTLTGPNCGWPPDRVHTFLNLRTRDEVWRNILHLIDEAEHTLLFYFVGHGQLIDGNADLGMALVGTAFEPRYRRTGSLLWSDLRAEIAGPNRARRTDIIMLDCCYSGLATERGQGAADASERIGRAVDTDGMFTMTASRFNELAVHTADDEPVTYFAKFFSDIIRDGIAGASRWLTLLTVFDELRGRFSELRDEDIPQPPRPTQLSVGSAHRLLFARNSSPEALPSPGPDAPYPAPHEPARGERDGRGGAFSRRRALLAAGGLCATAATAGAVAWLGPGKGSGGHGTRASGPATPPRSQVTGSTGAKPGQSATTTPSGRVTRAVPFLTPLTGHTDTVSCVAFGTTDPHLLASASKDTTIRLWNVADPAHARALGKPVTGHAGAVGDLAFRPRGTVLAGCGDRNIQLWDVARPDAPQPLGAPLDGHADGVNSVAFSGDGNILASTGADRTIVLWDTTDPTVVQQWGQPLYGHTDNVMTAVFSPRGHLLASGGFDNHVRLWNVADPAQPQALAKLTGHTGPVLSLAFSPDGLTLASAGLDGTVRLWNVNDPERARQVGPTVTGHTNAVNAIAVSRRSVLAGASSDGTIVLDDITDPAHPRVIGHPLTGFRPGDPVMSAAFTADGRLLAAGGWDDTIRLWRLS